MPDAPAPPDPDRAEVLKAGQEIDRLMGSLGYGINLDRFRGSWPLAWWVEAFRVVALRDPRPNRPWQFAAALIRQWEAEGGPPKPKFSARNPPPGAAPPPPRATTPAETIRLAEASAEARRRSEAEAEECRAYLDRAASDPKDPLHIFARRRRAGGPT